MEELEGLSTEDIAPILGSQQIAALQMSKTIDVLRARVAELEAQLTKANGKKSEAVPEKV